MSKKHIRKIVGTLVGLIFSTSSFAVDCVDGSSNGPTCTVPPGKTSVLIEVWGGGGGGGGADVGIDGGGGAGGGSYCRGTFSIAAGTSLTVTPGAGGAGGNLAGFPGDSSVVTWAGGSITAAGGLAGNRPGFGNGGTACAGPGLTGYSGGNGAPGANTPAVEGGGGGGSGGSAGNGLPGLSLVGGLAVTDGGKGGNEESDGDTPGGGGGGSRLGTGLSGGSGKVKMTFSAPPLGTVNSIPTMSEWGLLILGSLMAVFGLLRVRRNDPN